MADVFVSYKKEDRARVDLLVAALADEGFSVWFDYQIETGEDWFQQILMQVRSSACVVGCWTNNSVQPDGTFPKSTNSHLSYLLTEHREAGAKLLPVMMDEGAIPAEFAQLQAEALVDWGGDRNDARWIKFVKRIETIAAPSAPGWARRRITAHDATLLAERSRREHAEDRAEALSAKLTEEVKGRAVQDSDLKAARAEAQRATSALVTAKDRFRAMETRLSEKETELQVTTAQLKAVERQLSKAEAQPKPLGIQVADAYEPPRPIAQSPLRNSQLLSRPRHRNRNDDVWPIMGAVAVVVAMATIILVLMGLRFFAPS